MLILSKLINFSKNEIQILVIVYLSVILLITIVGNIYIRIKIKNVKKNFKNKEELCIY